MAQRFGYVLVVALPTELIPNPVFSREIPPTWWSWPALILTAALVGLLSMTYARQGDEPLAVGEELDARGMIGGALTYFAVGCPVCNKLVLLALGTTGAVAWFEPVQPLLQLAAVGLLMWALRRRLAARTNCPVPA